MASSETHFELFLRKSPKAGWALADAHSDRLKAIERAKYLLKDHPQGGVRVMKEVLKSDGSYESILLTSFGDCGDIKKRPSRTFIPQATSSCVSPGDLRTPAARKTYLEVMPRFLERHRVLPGELIYRTDLLEILEASGSEITQAVQRVAIARAEGDDLHSIARQLHELVQEAISGVFRDKKNGAFVKFEGSLEQVILACKRRPNAKIAFCSAIADRLMKETSWSQKLNGLVAIWKEAEMLAKPEREFANGLLSDYFSEWINTPGALNAILGDCHNAGEMVDRLISILEPAPTKPGEIDVLRDMTSAKDLREAIHLGLLPSARNTILTRVFDEISSNRRLIEGSLLVEFRLLKQFGDRLVKVLQASRRAEMYESFCARSKRLMSTDTVDAYLDEFEALERPRRLLELKDNIVGAEARQKMTSLLRALIGQPRFEAAAMNCGGKHLQVLVSLRSTQADLIKSDLPEDERIALAEAIDSLGVKVISHAHLLKQIAKKAGSPVLAALALFRIATEAMPRGQSAMLAFAAGGKLLKEPEALEATKADNNLRKTLRELSMRAREASTLGKPDQPEAA